MPRFEVTGPDGHKYQVEGPEGATEQDALAQVQKQVAAPPAEAAPAGVDDYGRPMGPATFNAGPDISTTIRNALAPAPNTTYGDVVPLAKDDTTGAVRLALPNMIRSPLIGLTQEGGQSTINPETGTLGITPEAQSVAPFFASPLRIGPMGAVPPGLAAREAPLSGEFRANPMAPTAVTRVTEAGDQPVAVQGPAVPTPFQPPASVEPPAVTPTGIPATPPEAPMAASAAPLPPAPKTMADAKTIASQYYRVADEAGGAQLPEGLANDLITAVKKIAPQTEEGRIVLGDTEITKLASRIEDLRDKPVTLAGAQEIDEGLGKLIEKEVRPTGQMTAEGRAILDLQTTFRDMVGTAPLTGQTAQAVEALTAGRAAWSQARKMGDIEQIRARAELTDNPATSFKSGIRVLLSNPRRIRGYSAEEVAALRQAAARGTIGNLLHVFGSRLIPMGAGIVVGSSGGPVAGAFTAVATHAGTSAMRDLATYIQGNRLQNALDVIGGNVPRNTLLRGPQPLRD